MTQTKEIILKLRLSAKHLLAVVALSLIIWRPAVLDSANMTMTSYYPAPYGGYGQLMTTGNTFLAEDSSAVNFLSRGGGRTCIGSSTADSSGYCNKSSGTGSGAGIYTYGNAYFGLPIAGGLEGTASGMVQTAGKTNLSYNYGEVNVGGYVSSPSTGQGMFLKIPISSTSRIYLGSGGWSRWYRSIKDRFSSAGDDSNLAILVDTTQSGLEGGIGVAGSSASARFWASPGSNWAEIGGMSGTDFWLMAGGNDVLWFRASDKKMTVYGDAQFNKDIYLSGKIYNFCFQKVYGRSTSTSCGSGYALVGIVPHDGLSGMASRNNPQYTGASSVIGGVTTNSFSNAHVTAGGWMTCCALDLPTK